MAYHTNDVLRLTVHQVYDQQQCLNVFFYKVNSELLITSPPDIVGMIFWDTVKAPWLGSVVAEVTFDKVVVENLDGDLSFGEYTIPVDEKHGGQTSDGLAAFCAFSIQLNRTNRLTRHGQKRLVGVPESSVGDYGVLSPAALLGVQEIADAFASDVFTGVPVAMNPVIVGFPNDDRPDRVEVPINTATARVVITTQNSRKRGHGS